jgi:hypothetical protein
MIRFYGLVLTAVLGASATLFTQYKPATPPRPTLRSDYLQYWQGQLNFKPELNKVDMDEVSASLAWVLALKPLPDAIIDRCIGQVNNPNKDEVGVFKWKMDAAPPKRTLCLGIIEADKRTKAKQTAPDVQAELRSYIKKADGEREQLLELIQSQHKLIKSLEGRIVILEGQIQKQ